MSTVEDIKKLLTSSRDDSIKMYDVLLKDRDINNTLAQLQGRGLLWEVVRRIPSGGKLSRVLQWWAAVLSVPNRQMIAALIKKENVKMPFAAGGIGPLQILDICVQMRAELHKLGMATTFPSRANAPNPALQGTAPTAQATGSGHTGVNPTELPTIPILWDKVSMWWSDKDCATGNAAYLQYKGPSCQGNMTLLRNEPSSRLKAFMNNLFRMHISSVFPHTYLGKFPTRANLIKLAANKHALEPDLVAAVVMVEQWDQSRNEDAADYQAAVHHGKNTSIGLGQVTVKTAQNSDLFADLLKPATRSALGHSQVGHLLASDEFNIFATARYIRKVANLATAANGSVRTHFRAVYPNIDFGKFGDHSRTWPLDNIGALASEYTSTPWDTMEVRDTHNPPRFPPYTAASVVMLWSRMVSFAYTNIKTMPLF